MISAIQFNIFNRYLSFAVLIIFFFSASGFSESKKFDSPLVNNSGQPWKIVAEKISYDEKTDQYFARGNAVISRLDKKLESDFIRFDHKSLRGFAKGNVILTSGVDKLYGDQMEIDLNTQTGTLYNGSIFLKDNHFHIKGNKIQKSGESTYTIDSASITTCDGDNPAWKITGKNLNVTIEGYGFANNAVLWTKKIPILYTPFIAFPVKTKRQSGLLTPEIGSSDRKGTEYTQPVFWSINKNSDATFYEHYMSRRGNQLGFEYRYVIDDVSKWTVKYDFLHDKKIDDGKSDSSDDWGYDDDGQDILRPNHDRYWFRMKLDQAVPFGFFAKLDLDIVSDQDYLKEFKDGYTGFRNTERYFDKTFNRELDDYDDPVRVNRLNLNKSWSKYSINAEARWYDNVIARRWQDTDTTLHKLPYLGFDVSKKQFYKTPFYWNLDSEYTYFFSDDGSKGHRTDLHPRFYFPLRFKNYVFLEPSAGLRETSWHIDKFNNNAAEKQKDNSIFRTLYDTKINLSSEIFRVYNINVKNIDRIKHTIRPQIIYDYTPQKPHNKYPSFDSIDSIEKENLLTYSIINTFTSRSGKKRILKKKYNKDKKNTPYDYQYNQICRFKIEQSYDINEKREDNPLQWANKKNKRPFSPIYGEIEFDLNKYLYVDADAEWSSYEGDFITRNIKTRLSDNRGDSLFFEHRYTKGYTESIYAYLLLNLSDSISAYAENERNIKDGDNIKSATGFIYMAQCWAFHFGFTNDDGDSKYTFMVDLYGLGGVGGRNDLADTINDTYETR